MIAASSPHARPGFIPRLLWVGALAFATFSVSGCAMDTRGESSALYESPATHSPPLETVARTSWEMAPAGCEDRLPRDVEFRHAGGAPGLVVAVDSRGRAVCVDTLEAVQAELEGSGRVVESYDLAARFDNTSAPRRPASLDVVDVRAGDPSPQPSCPADEMQMDAPPDASAGTRGGDPSPQPS